MVSLLLVGTPPLRGHLLPTPLHCRVICPSLCPNQEHKAHLAQFLLLERGRADACHAYEHLTRGLGTHRYHQTPTEGQLLLQCCGEPWAASCDYNAVVGRVFRPAPRAVAEMHDHIVVPELAQTAAGQAVEWRFSEEYLYVCSGNPREGSTLNHVT